MDAFNFAFSLFAIILGLSLVEVLTGFARALKRRRSARSVGLDGTSHPNAHLGWLTPMLALFVMLDLTSFWEAGRNDARQFWPKHDRIDRVPDAADQLRIVMQSQFTAQPLLNKSEARLFRAIDKMVTELAPPGWQVMAQVSLGEILRAGDKAAYGCINSKRVDLLLVDAECNSVHAIEYQGGRHFKGAHATAARDAVKNWRAHPVRGTGEHGNIPPPRRHRLCRGSAGRHGG